MRKTELLKTAKPILFNTEMVRDILDGRKTQTRRVVGSTVQKAHTVGSNANKTIYVFKVWKGDDEYWVAEKPKYLIGDVLWVREPAEIVSLNGVKMTIGYMYGADELYSENIKHMAIPDRFIDLNRTSEIVENFYLIKPKWILEMEGIPNGCIKEMARIFLKVTGVRVERLQDITFEDVVKEGLPFDVKIDKEDIVHKAKLKDAVFEVEEEMLKWWINTWNSTAKDGYKWADNPYVFVYDFEVLSTK